MQVAADAARFDVVRQLSAVEGRKRYEFLEVLTGAMEAHLAFFERGVKARSLVSPVPAPLSLPFRTGLLILPWDP